jgi:hypothetical protein
MFFLDSTFKNKLESKISEFLAHSLILNSNLKLQQKLFKRFKTFECKRKKAISNQLFHLKKDRREIVEVYLRIFFYSDLKIEFKIK